MSEYITLIHTQWRNTWKIFAATMGFVVVFSIVFYLSTPAGELTTVQFNDQVGLALGVIFLAQTFWVMHLLLSQDGDGRLTLEMPEYLLELPISSWKLAAARITFGISTCLILSIFDMTVYYAVHDARFEEALPIMDGILSTILGYVLLQPIVWWLGPGGFICTASFIVGAPALWSLAVISSDFMRKIQDPIDRNLLAITSYDWLYIIPLMVGSMYLIGVAGIALHRKGRFSDLRMPSLRRKSTLSLESIRTETFSSPEEALQWHEYREHWKLYPRLVPFLFVGSFLFVSLAIWPDGSTGGKVSVAVVLTFSLAFSGMASFCMFRAWRQSQNRTGSFLFYQPVTTLELSTARWKSNARALGLGLAPLLGILLLSTFFAVWEIDGVEKTMFGHLTNHHSAFLVLFLFAAMAVYLWLGAWAGSSAESFVGVLLGLGLIAIPIVSILELRLLSSAQQEEYAFLIATGNVVAYAAVGGMVAGFIWLTVRAVGYLRRNNLLNLKALQILALISPIGAIGLIFTRNFGQVPFRIPMNYESLWGGLVFALFIFYPILTTPGAMHWYRHRR